MVKQIFRRLVRPQSDVELRSRDLDRLKEYVGSRPVTLCLSHTWGGGVQRYLDDRSEQLRERGCCLLVLTPPPPRGSKHGIAINVAPAMEFEHLVFLGSNLTDGEVLAVLKEFDIAGIEIHSLARWPAGALPAVPAFSRKLGVSYSFFAHDFVSVCPQANLINETGIYCGEEGDEQCDRCLSAKSRPFRLIHRGAAFGTWSRWGAPPRIADWRSAYHGLLRGAAEVVAPSRDTAGRIKRYFPDISVCVAPHVDNTLWSGPPLSVAYDGHGAIRVAIVGAIGEHKGSGIILNLARDARARQLPLEFILIGDSNRAKQMSEFPNISIAGPYEEREIYDRLKAQRCHIALLPSVWPETHSYTFSIVTSAGFPTVIFDIGAPAERAQSLRNVELLPQSMMTDAAAVNDRLIAFAGN